MLQSNQINRSFFLFISAIFVLFLTACTDNPMSSPEKEDNLLGDWTISNLRVDGEDVDRANQEDVIVELTLRYSNTGRCTIEDFGQTRNHAPLSVRWSVEKDLAQIEIAGENTRKFNYTRDGNQLTLAFYDDDRFTEYVYHTK